MTRQILLLLFGAGLIYITIYRPVIAVEQPLVALGELMII